MDWTVYWFMFPVCVVIASAAMFSGISGAAMLMPTFLIGFPLIGAPPLATVEAIGMVWAVPGAVVGAFVGTRLQGRVNETVARWFFSGLFAVIGVTFLLAFTVFSSRFT